MSTETPIQTERAPVNKDAGVGEVTLSIVIPSYNTRGLLYDCLRSIYENPPREPYEIFVIDDGSKDGSSDMVRACFPDVWLLVNETNRHYAHSNNRAFDLARGDYVLMLNSDTVVLPAAFDQMVDFLKSRPDVGALGCKLLNEDGSIQWSVKSLPNPGAAMFGARSIFARLWPNNPFTRHHLLHLGRDMTKPFEVVDGYVSSAASMHPRSVVKQAGDLDPDFAYHIDADYCKRITDLGYKCYYLPTATIIHLNHKGGTMASLMVRFRSLMMFEVQSYRYYRKHLERSPFSPMRLVVALGLTAHFLASATSQALREVSSALRAAQSRGA